MVLLGVASSHISLYFYEKNRIKSYWADYQNKKLPSKKNGRFPSSQMLLEGSPETENLIRPFFQFNTYNKYLNYDLEVKFRTNKDDDHILKTSKDAIKEAVTKTLVVPAQGESKESLTKIFQDNLIEELIDQFVKTLKVYKIVNGSFQIDLNFKPRVSAQFSFNEELSSNQLIQWDAVQEHELELASIHHTVAEKAISMKLPYNNEPFQYKGGQISLWFKLVDLKPDFQLNSPRERVATGFIRYRKYFKAPHLLEEIKLKSNAKIDFEKVSFTTINEHSPYITVDAYQVFNFNRPIPKIDRVEFHFGKLLEDNFHRDSVLSSFHKKKDPIVTGELIFSGRYNQSGHDYKFDSIVQSLVFDFNRGNFTRDSKIKTMLKSRTNTVQQKGRIQNEIYTQLLDGLGIDLIQKLKLGSVQYFQGGRK